ncbi:hypothetical protein [Deinococcus aquaedulcis]|uniref:hypothetical protein n=1 Tax=Deinococcus aquaedulcis TaxID=2840455 RepID=UPI001C83FBA7|nr:hypothetical protein [Deinococcus aquaedulcis]
MRENVERGANICMLVAPTLGAAEDLAAVFTKGVLMHMVHPAAHRRVHALERYPSLVQGLGHPEQMEIERRLQATTGESPGHMPVKFNCSA